MGVMLFFGPKLLNIPEGGVGGCARKSPLMKLTNGLYESSKKNSPKPKAISPNKASWCTDTDGFLEHSPSRGSLYYKGPTLQKIIVGVFLKGSPRLWQHLSQKPCFFPGMQ